MNKICVYSVFIYILQSGNFWELGLCAKFLVLINFMVKLYLNSLHYYTIQLKKSSFLFDEIGYHVNIPETYYSYNHHNLSLPFSVVIYIIHTHSNGGVPRRYKTVLIDCLQK